MKHASLALVEPVYEVNVGHMARLMKNFGVEQLYLIQPRIKLKGAVKFAAHAAELLTRAEEVDWGKLAERFDLLVGTTAVPGRKPSNVLRAVVTPEGLAEELADFTGKVCLVFGRETTGLRNEELNRCDIVVHIPTGTNYRTLNIAHAAAILLYEVSRARKGVGKRISPREQRERAVEYAWTLAQLSGFPAYKAELMRRALIQLLGRSTATRKETSLLIGLLRKAVLAIQRGRTRG